MTEFWHRIIKNKEQPEPFFSLAAREEKELASEDAIEITAISLVGPAKKHD